MPNPTVRASATALPNSNRRLFLLAGTAAAVFATVKRAAAAPATDVDPIFAAIERHKEAFAALGVACARADDIAAEEEGRTVTEADEAALNAAHRVEADLQEAFLNTAPTTAAGMRAALEHAIYLDAGFVPDTWGALARSFLASPLLAVGGIANV